MNFFCKSLAIFVLMSLLFASGVRADDFRISSEDEDIELINTNRDENGKIIRTGYLTNPWYSNWSIGVSFGGQTMVSGTDEHNTGFDNHTARITPMFDITLAKWFTPVIGVRGGLSGWKMEESFPNGWEGNHYTIARNEDRSISYFSEFHVHGEALWNVINSIWGYKANRFYNFIPYAHFGLFQLGHPDEGMFAKVRRDREFMVGLGVYNTFRISNSIVVALDWRWGNISGRYHDESNGGRVNYFSANLGVAYTLEKWYWARSKGLEISRDRAIAAANRSLADADRLRAENEALKVLINELNSREPEGVKVVEAVAATSFQERVMNADLVLYYEINISKLNFTERHHLDEFVKETLERDPEHIFYLTGSADKGTGTFEINTRLSRERAHGIREILMNEYHVPEEQIVIKATIISDKHEDGALDRCVLIEKE